MFDIGWTELAIVALIGLLVIGPKELPATMRMIAGWIGKVRGLAREFQSGLDDMMRETELDKLKEQAEGMAHGDLDTLVENTIDPDGTIRNEIDYGAAYEPFQDFDPEPDPELAPTPVAKKRARAKPKAAAAKKAGGKTGTKKPAKSAKAKAAGSTKSANQPSGRNPTASKAAAAKKSGAQTSSAKISSAKISSAKTSSAKTSSAKTSSAKTSSAKTSSAKTSSAKAGAVKSATKSKPRAPAKAASDGQSAAGKRPNAAKSNS